MDDDHFLEPQTFTMGAIGPKGQRVFFFQSISSDGSETISMKCEKQQIKAMADVLEFLLESLPPDYNIPLQDLEPIEPADLQAPWQLGDLNICYSWEKDQVELIFSEMHLPPGELEAELGGLEDEIIEDPQLEPMLAKNIKFIITREQADGFVRMSRKILDMGRPICPFCEDSLNHTPESNFCPCWN